MPTSGTLQDAFRNQGFWSPSLVAERTMRNQGARASPPHPEPIPPCHRPATAAEIDTDKELVSALRNQTPSPMSASRQAKHALMHGDYGDEFAARWNKHKNENGNKNALTFR
jgi:hypothetical protein